MTHGGRFALGVDSDELEGRERGSETVAAEMGDERIFLEGGNGKASKGVNIARSGRNGAKQQLRR